MVSYKKKISKSGTSKWKALQLNESLLSSGIEGLIGIEELTNYSLVENRKKSRNYELISNPKYKVIKVKAASHSATALADTEENEQIPPKVATKKTKKKKKGNLLESSSQNAIPSTDKITPNKTKKKPKPSKNLVNPETVIKDTFASEGVKNAQTSLPKQKSVKRKRKLSSTSLPEQEQKISKNPVKKKIKAAKSAECSNTILSIDQHCKSLKPTETNGITSKPSNKTLSKTKLVTKMKSKTTNKSKKSKSKSKVAVVDEDIVEEVKTLPPVKGMDGWAGLNLPDSILRALADKGFMQPTEIQARSLPAALLGRRDIMGAAETGSGKTLAFGIPILYGILQQKSRDEKEAAKKLDLNPVDMESSLTPEEQEESESDDDEEEDIGVDAKGFGCVRVIDNMEFDEPIESIEDKPVNSSHNHTLYALVLTPTRELAVQVRDHIKAAAKYTGIRVAVVIGGLAAQKQERLLRTKPEIVVATPGRLWELIQEGNAYLQQVDSISYLAIDETDRMTEKGHFQELRSLLERINVDPAQVKRRQNFVFSATLTMVHEPPQRKKKGKNKMRVTPGQKLQDVVEMIGITQPKIVDVTQESGMSGTLEEAQIRCSFTEKDVYLYYFLLRHPGRTLVFCNSISCVRRLAQLLSLLQCAPLPIHANMMQKQRLRNLDKFTASPTGLLLATDVAARGLDIPDVQHVVHYQVPRTSETYVHRSGRTARASKQGLTLLLVEPEENQAYARLCRTLGRTKELADFEVAQDLLTAAKQRMNLARDIDQLELNTRRSDAELGWFQKAMTDMDMFLDKDDLPMRISKKEMKGNKKVAVVKRKELASLLSRPLFAVRK